MRKMVVFLILALFINGSAFAKTRVVTTTFILSSIVKQIGGKYVDTAYLIPSGSNPHIFAPRPKSLMKLANSDLYLGVGYGFEFWINGVKDILKGKDIMFLADYYKNPIDKIVIKKNTIANPHIWLDMNFMGNVAVYKISNRLCLIDKTHCNYFKRNADKLHKTIMKIKNMYINTFRAVNKSCFLDVKPAFEYLLRSVGKKSCCVLIKKGNEEPRIGDIKEAVENCRCKKGFVLYIGDIQLAKMIAEKLGFAMVNLNPLGDPEKLNTYPKLLLYDLKQFKKVMK